MNFILLLACMGFITGLFVLLKISPMDMTQSIFKALSEKPQTLKDSLNESTKRKKQSYFKREIAETKAILEMTGRSHKFPLITALSMFLFVVGASLAIMMGNWFLAPVLAIGFMFLPFWYVRLTQTHFKKDISSELETALSIITTGYLRTENIMTAVEENIAYLNPPVLSVLKSFLYQIKMVNPDIISALQEMKPKIDNPVFREWVDAVILCQSDRSLKSTLTPITTKLSDMRIVNGELETLVTAPRQEFLTMVALVVCNIPLLYFLNSDWYHTLMFTVAGQIVLAICGTAIFVSTAFVIKLTQPIEYKR
ncbi:hypothetical protein [Chakrabartyella piscis]|uniref:type II secretion system F family protein n=1 Tax=Chakrabartyella piscis TaxID=2918914 RepID=UPI002958B603|nr:hypothetical protein [Chakrabartyella piscis]